MKKITKLLTIFALCGLFVFSNTSGIEDNQSAKLSTPLSAPAIDFKSGIKENQSAKLSTPLSAPAIDFKSGQWYFLEIEYVLGTLNFQPLTYEGDFGIYADNFTLGIRYFSCYKFVFSGSSFTMFINDGQIEDLEFSYMDNFGYTMSICFAEYAPNSLISYYKYFTLQDNDNYDKVYLKESFNLKTSQYNPLIYLGGSIFDNVYAQTPYELQSLDLTIFEGRFVSGGNEYTSIVLTYQNFEGLRYTFDNGETYKTVPIVADSNYRYGVADISYVVNGVKTSIINKTLVVVGQNINALVLPFTYRFVGNEKLTIYEYSNAHPLAHTPAYNMYELLKLRPANTPIGTDITDSEGGLLGGAFGLIGLVFTSLAGFLSFQLFPGLTLGLLILIPLVITIIVLIFKAVK